MFSLFSRNGQVTKVPTPDHVLRHGEFMLFHSPDEESLSRALHVAVSHGLLDFGSIWIDGNMVITRNEFSARLVSEHQAAFLRRIQHPKADAAIKVYRNDDNLKLDAFYRTICHACNHSFDVWVEDGMIVAGSKFLGRTLRKIIEDGQLRVYAQTAMLWEQFGAGKIEVFAGKSKSQAKDRYDRLIKDGVCADDIELDGDRVVTRNPLLARCLTAKA